MNPELELYVFDKNQCWDFVFQRICEESGVNYEFSCSDARRSGCRDKNRYKDIIPFNHSRVRLPEVDYINANLAEMPEIDRSYILTQSPMLHTVSHFWLMAWVNKCSVVVMLNRLVEKDVVKGSPYHPGDMSRSDLDVNGNLQMADVSLSLSLTSTQPLPHYTIRKFVITNIKTNENRDIDHYQYTTWPDSSVPENPENFLSFIHLIRSSLPPSTPPIVHCSAGVGRSGTFCLIDACLSIAEKNVSQLDVRRVLLSLRRFRANLVQVPDQLRFSYQSIVKALKMKDLIPQELGEVSEVDERMIMALLGNDPYINTNNNNNKNNNSKKNNNNNNDDDDDDDDKNTNNNNNNNNNNRNNNNKSRKLSREEIILRRCDEERRSVRKRSKGDITRNRYSLARIVPHQASLDDSNQSWFSNNDVISGEPIITAGGEDGDDDDGDDGGDGYDDEEEEDGGDSDDDENFADDEIDDLYRGEEEDEDDGEFTTAHVQIRRRTLGERIKQTWKDIKKMKNNQIMHGLVAPSLKRRIIIITTSIIIIITVILLLYYRYFYRA